MTKRLISETKGLKRATKQLKYISKAVEHLNQRSNDSKSESGIKLFLFISFLRIVNIKFVDMQISEFKTISERSSKNYFLLLISLYIQGNAAKSTVIKNFGLSYPVALKMLDQLVKAGYVEIVPVKTLKNIFGSHFYDDATHLQLTSKGYDKVSFIYSLLIDERLL